MIYALAHICATVLKFSCNRVSMMDNRQIRSHLVLGLLTALLLVGLQLGKLDLHVLVADVSSGFKGVTGPEEGRLSREVYSLSRGLLSSSFLSSGVGCKVTTKESIGTRTGCSDVVIQGKEKENHDSIGPSRKEITSVLSQ